MALQTVYRHSATNPVRGREVDINFDWLLGQINYSSQFSATASTTIANTGTETSLIGTGEGSLTLPANTLIVGRSINFSLRGVYSTIAAPGTLQFRVRIGGISGTVVLDSTAQTPPVSAGNRGFELSGIIQCRSIGATGTVFSQGEVRLSSSATDSVTWDMENTATSTIDTTTSQEFQISADWQTADVGNTITGTNFLFQIYG